MKLGTLALPTVAYGQLLRPYPQYTGFAMQSPPNRNSMYHSAQFKLEKRFAKGGTVLGSYTWSKLISDTDTLTGWLEPGGGAGGVQDNYNIRAERSLALYDTPHRMVLSYIYDLPLGKGQRWGSDAPGVLNKIISGWGINGVTTFQSGSPLNLSTAVNTTNSFGGGQRPNSTGASAKLEGAAQTRLTRWFDTTKFTLPASFTFGNLARTLPDVRSHGIANYDFTAFKNTQVTERVGIQFRAEIFNLFNRVRFGYPGRGDGQSGFRGHRRPIQRSAPRPACIAPAVLMRYPAGLLRRVACRRGASAAVGVVPSRRDSISRCVIRLPRTSTLSRPWPAGWRCFDYNNDGLLDVFLVNGGKLAGLKPGAT